MKVRALLSAFAAVMVGAASLMAGVQPVAGQNPKVFLPVVLKGYPPPPNIFGFQLEVADAANGLNELVEAQASWTRLLSLLWSNVEPNEGERNWSALGTLDQQLINLAQRKIKVSLIIHWAPRWAQRVTGQFCGPVKPEKYTAMAKFVRDAVARYSAPPYNVEYWEFGNEPDAPYATNGVDNFSVFGCWGNASDPFFNGEEFGRAMHVAYQAAKQANPNVQFMIGGLLMDCDPRLNANCIAGKFFEGILRSVQGSFDGVSFHAYDFISINPTEANVGKFVNANWNVSWDTTGPGLIVKGRFLKEKMAAAGITGKFLINTENGVIGGAFDGPEECGPPNCELTKAYYVPQSYASALAEGLRGNIWYSYYGWRGSALVGRSSGTRYPAYNALKFAAATLGRPTYLGPVASADLGGIANVAGYKFNRDGTIIWVVWSRDGVERTATLADAPDAVHDPVGTALSTSNIKLSIKPLYLIWNP
jgi:hypothetical protein